MNHVQSSSEAIANGSQGLIRIGPVIVEAKRDFGPKKRINKAEVNTIWTVDVEFITG